MSVEDEKDPRKGRRYPLFLVLGTTVENGVSKGKKVTHIGCSPKKGVLTTVENGVSKGKKVTHIGCSPKKGVLIASNQDLGERVSGITC